MNMNEVQALNILTNLANKGLKTGIFENINESGGVYNALLVLSKFIPPVPVPETPSEDEVYGDPQGESE